MITGCIYCKMFEEGREQHERHCPLHPQNYDPNGAMLDVLHEIADKIDRLQKEASE